MSKIAIGSKYRRPQFEDRVDDRTFAAFNMPLYGDALLLQTALLNGPTRCDVNWQRVLYTVVCVVGPALGVYVSM